MAPTVLKMSGSYDTYPVAPLGVEPAPGTGSHVTVLYVTGPQIHVALFIGNKVALVADTAYLP